MSQSIDIGIINYNGGDCLLKCIETISAMTGVNVNVYVFDNASSDHSLDLAKEKYPQYTYIKSNVNLGYAGGCNRLLDYLSSDIIALCNMDLEFAPDWAAQVIDCFEKNEQISSVASLVIQKETGQIYASDIHFFWDLHPMCVYNKDMPHGIHEVFGAYGAIMTFRKEIFEKIGKFDEDYFLFCEETEFFLRMKVNKLKVFMCPAARIFHHRSVSTIRYSPMKLFFSERNRMWTAFKYLPWWYVPFLFPASLLRLYFMSKGGVPQQDGQGKRIKALNTIIIILKAWLVSFLKLPREWKKKRMIWENSSLKPFSTIGIIKNYKLQSSNLHVK